MSARGDGEGLLTLLLIIFSVLTMFGGVAIAVGYQPPSEWVEILHLDECEPPCWLGITPGQTNIDEAFVRLEEVFGDSILRTYGYGHSIEAHIWLYPSDYEFFPSFTSSTDSDLVQEIDLKFETWERPTIPELAEILGTPEWVRTGYYLEDQVSAGVWFSEKQLWVWLYEEKCGRVSMDTPIRHIHFGNEPSWNISEAVPWRGFGQCYAPDSP